MMNRLLNIFKQNSAGFLSGLLIGTSYIPFPPWAIFFCYVPLWISVLTEKSVKRVFVQAWWAQFILTLIGFHWVAYTVSEFGQMPWPVGFLALLIFAAAFHIYIPISVMLVVWLKNKAQINNFHTLILLALSLILFERIWPSLFSWHLGYTFLWAKWPIYQWADIIGFEGLSSIVLIINALAAYFWLQAKNSNKKLLIKPLSVFLLFIALVSISGSIHGQKWNNTDASIKVLASQANIGNFEKIFAEKGNGFQDEILTRFISLTKKGIDQFPDSDLLIWPETAVPDYLDEFYKNNPRVTQLTNSLKSWKKPLLTGAFSKDHLEKDLNKNIFNSIFLFSNQGERLGLPYNKTHLLAYGEYLPFSEQFPFLLKLVPIISNFGRGHGPTILTWPKSESQLVHIGPQVCYEGLYPYFSRSLAIQGADLLVNVTNDSWFGRTFEPRQHLIMTLARAIEVRRPLLRSTNTGITTGILANGDLLPESLLHQEWVGQLEVKYKKQAPLSFYATYGDIDFWFYLFLFLLILGINKVVYDRTRRT